MSRYSSIDRRMLLKTIGVAAAASLAPTTSFAQEYPNQGLKIILPFSPGGSADRLCRLTAKWLGDQWQQPVIVEPRVGATGMLGAELVAKSPPDGYTVLFTSTALVQAPIMTDKPLYVIDRDLTPVCLMAGLSVVLVVRSSSEIRDLADYVAVAKQKPGTISYGSIGPGSSLHVYGETLGSGLIDQSQKMTVAAMQMADMKVWAHLS